jgi:hypothetical protein
MVAEIVRIAGWTLGVELSAYGLHRLQLSGAQAFIAFGLRRPGFTDSLLILGAILVARFSRESPQLASHPGIHPILDLLARYRAAERQQASS